MKDVIADRLTGVIANPFSFDRLHVGLPLNSLSAVSTDEVRKLIGSMPAKSSPMDFVPTSCVCAAYRNTGQFVVC